MFNRTKITRFYFQFSKTMNYRNDIVKFIRLFIMFRIIFIFWTNYPRIYHSTRQWTDDDKFGHASEIWIHSNLSDSWEQNSFRGPTPIQMIGFNLLHTSTNRCPLRFQIPSKTDKIIDSPLTRDIHCSVDLIGLVCSNLFKL